MVCPARDHNDTDASCYVNTNENVFKCHGCGKKGSSIDFVMMVEECSIGEAISKITGEEAIGYVLKEMSSSVPKKKNIATDDFKTAQYDYIKDGNKIYSSIRYDFPDGSKEFRMATWTDGKLTMGLLKEIERIPYKLDEFKLHRKIWFVEGEKCAESLHSIGIFATCIAGGSKAKIDDIIKYFNGKDVVLLPDNDDTGREFVKLLSKSLSGVAEMIQILDVSTAKNCKGYDVADYIDDKKRDGKTKSEIREDLILKSRAALYICEGEYVHALTGDQQEAAYEMMLSHEGLDLSEFIPGFKGRVRPLIPGDCVAIVGGTGSGKTAFLQSVAQWARPRTILNFNMELSVGVFYERTMSISSSIGAVDVEKLFRSGNKPSQKGLDHIYSVPLSNLTIEDIVNQFHLFVKVYKKWPDIVMIDYLQLLKGKGPIYERTTSNAEDLRRLPKTLETIVFFSSQKSRPPQKHRGGDNTPTLNDAKDSGAIENSASVYIDLRPHATYQNVKVASVLKCTRGVAGFEVEIGWDGSCTKFISGAVSDLDKFKYGKDDEDDSYVPF
jgi:5S rRNA maturation endonuclease (ribonuclease M5)